MIPRLRVLLLFLAFASTAAALEVRDLRWGFDGKAMPGRFTILSVLVAESGPKPFDGTISLLETRGMGSRVGAPLVQQIYLTPGTQRWVQFTPFVVNEYEWELRWGKGDDAKRTVEGPKRGGPASVILLDPNGIVGGEVRLRGFYEDLFPTTVAATDTLDQLAFDHVPRWDAPRREAFLDWLRRGGIVHLLRGPSGQPIFEGDLAVLNTSSNRTRVGAGWVLRHDAPRAEFSVESLKAAGFPARELRTADANQAMMIYGFDQNLLRSLAALTKPEIAWWLLYLLTLAYLAFIGPVHYRWSRKVDYRVAIGGFLGTVTVFALAFIFVGARGSGERQTVYTVGMATALGGNRWDVMQWSCAFATSGDYYSLTHEAPANIYSATTDMEAVNGRIVGGKEGRIEVDIPLYSSRPFMHRAAMSGPAAELRVKEWGAKPVLEMPEGLDLDVAEGWLRMGGDYQKLNVSGRELAADGKPVVPSSLFTPEEMSQAMQREWGNQKWDMKGVAIPVLARYRGDVSGMENALDLRQQAPGHGQVFLWAKAPESFAMKGKGFGGELGWMLFVFDVFAPDGAPSPSAPVEPEK